MGSKKKFALVALVAFVITCDAFGFVAALEVAFLVGAIAVFANVGDAVVEFGSELRDDGDLEEVGVFVNILVGVAAICVALALVAFGGIQASTRLRWSGRRSTSILDIASSILPATLTNEVFGDTHEVLEEMAETASRWQIRVCTYKAAGWAVLFTLREYSSPETLADALGKLFRRR